MNRIILSILSLFIAAGISAQKITVSGTIVDQTGESLPAATVVLLNAKDSAQVTGVASKTDGKFTLLPEPHPNQAEHVCQSR